MGVTSSPVVVGVAPIATQEHLDEEDLEDVNTNNGKISLDNSRMSKCVLFLCYLTPWQCGQMAKLFFKYLAIYNNNENLPNSITYLPKQDQNFAKY